MNGMITTHATSGHPARTGNWATRGAVAAGQGMVLFGCTLASLMLWAALLVSVALIPLGVGLPLTAVTVRAMRGHEASVWRHVAGWCGSAAAAPRGAGPVMDEPVVDEKERALGFWARFGSL